MAETRDLSFLIDSPEYRQNAAFVTACYREMLDRDIEAEELFRWCRQLDGVYSRKSLIAALSGSAKFGNRFEIKDIDQYRKRAFVPRAIQHVLNKLNADRNGYDKGCFGPVPLIHARFDFPKYGKSTHTWPDELDMLSLCQLETLRDQIGKTATRLGNVRSFGVIAEDIVEKTESSSEAQEETAAFVTSVDRIISLIESGDPELEEIDNLLIPVPVPTENGIEAIFDKHWSAATKGKNPRRWLVNRGEGTILFLNRHDYPINVNLSMNLTTLVKGAAVRVCQGQNSTVVRLEKKAARITLNLFLLPGENPVVFRFIGTSDEAEEITNVAVSRLSVDTAEIPMDCDMNRLGTGYYGAVHSDQKVRNALHNRGFSEIECIRLYHDNSIRREKITRFLQHDPNSSGDSFFVLKDEDNQKTVQGKNKTPSVRLYIAKKLSEID